MLLFSTAHYANEPDTKPSSMLSQPSPVTDIEQFGQHFPRYLLPGREERQKMKIGGQIRQVGRCVGRQEGSKTRQGATGTCRKGSGVEM